MKISEREWNNIYEKICRIAKKYGILNVPVSESSIFIYYNFKNIFNTEEDFKNMKKLAYEIESTLKEEKNSGAIEIKVFDNLEKIIVEKSKSCLKSV